MTDTTTIPPASTTPKAAPYWFPDTRTFIVAWMMISCFVILITLIFKPPGADNALLNTLLGAYFTVGFGGAIGWWMHSSKSSDDKNAPLINAAMKE